MRLLHDLTGSPFQVDFGCGGPDPNQSSGPVQVEFLREQAPPAFRAPWASRERALQDRIGALLDPRQSSALDEEVGESDNESAHDGPDDDHDLQGRPAPQREEARHESAHGEGEKGSVRSCQDHRHDHDQKGQSANDPVSRLRADEKDEKGE